jgi:hypothetical protein
MSALTKVDRATFPDGTFSLYVKSSENQREIEGKVVLHLNYPAFIKGCWIKLCGTASSSSVEHGVVNVDLLKGEEEYHSDGLHQVESRYEVLWCLWCLCACVLLHYYNLPLC